MTVASAASLEASIFASVSARICARISSRTRPMVASTYGAMMDATLSWMRRVTASSIAAVLSVESSRASSSPSSTSACRRRMASSSDCSDAMLTAMSSIAVEDAKSGAGVAYGGVPEPPPEPRGVFAADAGAVAGVRGAGMDVDDAPLVAAPFGLRVLAGVSSSRRPPRSSSATRASACFRARSRMEFSAATRILFSCSMSPEGEAAPARWQL